VNPRSTDDAPRYGTLRDYWNVLRRHRLLIAVITLSFIAAAFVVSKAQRKTYEATASLQFTDLSVQAQLLGGAALRPFENPIIAVQRAAQTVDQAKLAKDVQKELKKKDDPGAALPIDRLQNSIEGAVTSTTQLLQVTGTASNAGFAAVLANAYARAVQENAQQQLDRTLDQAEKSLEAQIAAEKQSDDITAQFRAANFEQRLSAVSAMRDLANPVEIVERAEVPTEPATPDTERNLALGALVGFFFGILAAFLRDSLDRRLHSVHEIHQELGAPVLGRVSDTAMGYPGLASNGKVAMSETDFEAFRILRTNLAALAPEGPLRSLMVTSGLPEEGKSTVSMSLASAAALAGQRVLLVECDLRRPSFAARLNVKREPGLTDYLMGKASPQDVLQTVDLREPATFANGNVAQRSRKPVATLVVISAGTPVSNPAELLISERFQEFIAKVTKAYDFVILDSSPVLAVADPLELVGQVDGILVCVRAQHATRDEARATRAAFSHVPDRPLGAVVTGLTRGSGDSYEYYYYGE
jgi:tyrosine-protein kinase